MIFESELKRSKIDQQRIYKNMLDNQNKAVISPKPYNSPEKIIEDHSFFYKNQPINIAPYTDKKYDIGFTILEHNPLVNPVNYYKYNKYLYRNNISVNNSLKLVGNNIIG